MGRSTGHQFRWSGAAAAVARLGLSSRAGRLNLAKRSIARETIDGRRVAILEGILSVLNEAGSVLTDLPVHRDALLVPIFLLGLDVRVSLLLLEVFVERVPGKRSDAGKG